MHPETEAPFPPELAAPFDPAASALLEHLRDEIDEPMLRELAAADYGHRAAENLVELRRIRELGVVTSALCFPLREVCGLVRWSTPDGAASREALRRAHVLRAFACAVLLEGDEASSVEVDGENETVGTLIESAAFLGPDAIVATGRLVAWRTTRLDPVPDRVLFALGLLLIAVLSRDRTRFPERLLCALSEWIVVEERRVRIEWGALVAGPEWALGLTDFAQRHHVWRALVTGIGEVAGTFVTEDAKAHVRGLVERWRASRP